MLIIFSKVALNPLYKDESCPGDSFAPVLSSVTEASPSYGHLKIYVSTFRMSERHHLIEQYLITSYVADRALFLATGIVF